jgi:ParB/RepB/Spo0J family partition protein
MTESPVKNSKPLHKFIKIEEVKIPAFRLSSSFTPEEHDEFDASIGLDQVQVPIHVIRDKDGCLWLADGYHRLESAKSHEHKMIHAIITDGTVEDAILKSAILNLKRGKVNPADLAEYVKGLTDKYGWSQHKIAEKLKLSKPYISQLLKITENNEVLEKLRNGLLSVKEAYSKVSGLTVKPISSEKASSEEISLDKASQGLSDSDLGVTDSLKEAYETGKRYTPIKEEEDEEITLHVCPICRRSFQSRREMRPIYVHKNEANIAIRVLKRLTSEAENEMQNLEGKGGENQNGE